MIKYVHKITGDFVEKANDHYYRLQADGRTIPVRFIEESNDWQPINQQSIEKKSLKALRTQFGFKQIHVAYVIGVDQPSYSKIENGIADLKDWQVDKLATLYKIHKNQIQLWSKPQNSSN
jgi:DNA-binding XRE family transcriptional regulator